MTEHQLIQELKLNNNESYKYLYDRYFFAVEKYILQNSGSADDAKDVFQDTLLVLHNKAITNTLELTASVKTFILSICRNIWLKKLKERKGISNVESTLIELSIEDKKIDEETNRNLLQKLNTAFRKLTGHCKMLLFSIFYKNKSINTVTAENGYKNVHTAQNQKYKCLEQARKEFKK